MVLDLNRRFPGAWKWSKSQAFKQSGSNAVAELGFESSTHSAQDTELYVCL